MSDLACEDEWTVAGARGTHIAELLDERERLAARLSDARERSAQCQARLDAEDEQLGEWHEKGVRLWERLVKRVGRTAAGPYPEAAGQGAGELADHLSRAHRVATGPIRFPLVKASLRMGLWGVLGSVLAVLAAFELGRLLEQSVAGSVAHVVAVVVTFAGIAAAPFAGFVVARWRLDATAEDEHTTPAVAGLIAGTLTALLWLLFTLTLL